MRKLRIFTTVQFYLTISFLYIAYELMRFYLLYVFILISERYSSYLWANSVNFFCSIFSIIGLHTLIHRFQPPPMKLNVTKPLKLEQEANNIIHVGVIISHNLFRLQRPPTHVIMVNHFLK